jgi:hypothetical protein
MHRTRMQLDHLNPLDAEGLGQRPVIVTGCLDPEPDHHRVCHLLGAGHPIQQQIHTGTIQPELERVDHHLTQLVGHHRHRRQPSHELGLIDTTNKHHDHHLQT